MELAGRLDHDERRAGDQVVRLEQAVDRRLRHKIPSFISEPHRQFARAQLGLFQRQFDDLVVDGIGDAVPHPAWRRGPILQCLRPTFEIAVIPAVERPAGNTQLIKGLFCRQMRLLDDAYYLELF